MKKISNWLFRKDLELNKRWWHRFIKVGYFLFLALFTIGFIIAVFAEPVSDFFLSHNVKKTTLSSYSNDYSGKDNDNTISKFIQQGEYFGIVKEGNLQSKYLYLNEYTFVKPSFCLKEPSKYIEGIQEVLIQDFKNKNVNNIIEKETISKLEKQIAEIFEKDKERRCVLFTNDSELNELENKENSIAMLEPNTFYYSELVMSVLLISFLTWLASALLYYKLIMYIIFGSKK